MAISEKQNAENSNSKGNVKRIVCYGCALLCDDVYVETDKDEKLIKTINSCFRGNSFITNYKSENRLTTSVKKEMGLKMNLDMNETIESLTSEIKNALSIKFYGVGAISYADQLAVFNLMKKLKDNGKKIYLENCGNLIQMSSKLGIPLTSIGQAINNADVFIFWRTDPTHSHPKLTGKALFTKGYFRSTGKEVKKFILIENEESDLTRLKDILINDSETSPEDLIKSISNLLNQSDTKNADVCGLDELNLRELQTYLKETEYGVVITTIPLDKDESNKWLNQISELLTILNEHAKGRYSLLPLPLTSNEMGQSTAALSIFSTSEIKELIEGGTEPGDLALVFGGEYLRDEYKTKEFEFPEKHVILFDNFTSDVSSHAKITIPYAITGIESSDIAVRLDGIDVPLEKWSEPPEEILKIREIFEKIKLE